VSLRSAGAAVAVAVALASSAAAQPAAEVTNAAAAPSPTIEIIVVESPAVGNQLRFDQLRFDRLRALLEHRLAALGTTKWSRAERVDAGDVLAASPAHLLRCWIDLREHRRARLSFAAPSGERFLLRDLELSGDREPSGDLAEIDRAALAEVIELSIGALLEDARAGLSRSETRALLARRAAPEPAAAAAGPLPPPTGAQSPLVDAPAPVRQAPQVETLRFEGGVFYAGQAVASGAPIDNGPGLSLALSREVGPALRRPRLFTAGWLSVQYLLPETVTGAQAGVRLDAVAARLGLELGSQRWRLRLGAGWDFVRVSPAATTASLALAPAHWTTTLAFQGAVRAQVARVASARLWVSLLADLLPTAVDYDVSVGGKLATVFSPWRIRPGIALEAMFP
jgi:hypothetical protein